LFVVSLYGVDLVDIYRTQGIKPVGKILEKRLQSVQYWLNRVNNYDVRYGYYESEKYLLVVSKEYKNLKVFKYKNGVLDEIDSIPVLTGLDGDKKTEGDLKTPIGVYRLVAFLANIDQYYGPFAFQTSYPNLYDKTLGKDGHGIWIHGYPLAGKRRDDNTKGCVVMKNNFLKELKKEINYQKTFLLIAEDKPFKAKKYQIAQILSFLYKWRDAWKRSDYWKYISFYSKKFRRYNGQNFEEFANYKKRVFAKKKGKKIKIYFKNINITPYQNIQNLPLFRITFKESYISPGYVYNGPKELYVKLNSDGSVKILLEK
jgi:murein L,D-transpeptidase YafK